MTGNVIYIAGPMALDPKYHDKFAAAESYLIMKGWTVLNPAWLPKGMRPHSYMPICLAMVKEADAIVGLAGWENSHGASIEIKYARYQGKQVFENIESVPVLQGEDP